MTSQNAVAHPESHSFHQLKTIQEHVWICNTFISYLNSSFLPNFTVATGAVLNHFNINLTTERGPVSQCEPPLNPRWFPFLRKFFRWVLISISQSLSRVPRFREIPGGWDERATTFRIAWWRDIHLVLPAFCADFVTLPALADFFSTLLMTPTATVCLMSRTAKRPAGRKLLAQDRSKYIGETEL